ncbi:MAG: efflux RND transporter periplasmic adaptor subunit, partial [Myxococcales bacterium]|nr:efflux RND transporter periplasmic adaptor subunit [Myxococcales bacterium]
MRAVIAWLVAACSSPEQGADGPSGPPAALVSVAEVQEGTLADTWSYLGEVRALERAELAAGAAGSLVQVTVREGQAVQAGQLLAEVDPGVASAQLAMAAAEARRMEEQLAQAQRTLDRLARVDAQVLAESELEAAQSSVRGLQAAADAARAAQRVAAATLQRHRVRAPFAGVVARRHVDPGDWVDPGRAVLDLVSTGAVEIRVEAPVALARRVAVGDEAQVQEPDEVLA